MGARPLRRVIQEQIEDRIADFVLDNPKIKNLNAKIVDGQITLEAADSQAVAKSVSDSTKQD